MKLFRVVLMVALLFSVWGEAQAAVGGFYLEGGHGFGEIDHTDTGTGFDSDVDVNNISAGFTIAPNAFSTSNKPSYTLRVGYDRLLLEDQNDVTMESHGFRIDNSFGWPLYKGDSARVTLGPLFRCGYYWGKSDGTNAAGSTAKTWLTSFGIGPELTTNIKLNEDLGLGFSVGYAFNFFVGRIKGDFPSDDYIGHRYNGYAVISLLFR